jgi:hypothetical protein
MVSENLELAAYKRAVDEIGHAGWTTCQLFLQQRVRELMLELSDNKPVSKVLKLEYETKSPKYDCHQVD